jgi:hypothetical protein
MKQSYEFPRITTRGYYDLHTGIRLNYDKKYSLYPKKKFNNIHNANELVIFVHGMRNTKWGAKHGGITLRRTLRKLGYKKHPVVTFSYDSNIIGAHLKHNHKNVLQVAKIIATQNGVLNLSKYIIDLKKINPKIKIHLVGHSLGCLVIEGCIYRIKKSKQKGFIKSVYLFGSPLETQTVSEINKFTKVINYYNPKDDVIKNDFIAGDLKKPSCLFKPKDVISKKCNAKDHRFKSYLRELKKFP